MLKSLLAQKNDLKKYSLKRIIEMPKANIILNPDTGDIFFVNKIIKIKQYKQKHGMYKYDILTVDGVYSEIFSSEGRIANLFQQLKY
tara:strand:+ start:163 stop:423 length:261 start_codon:yes stop_codon:yes gene_type:complete